MMFLPTFAKMQPFPATPVVLWGLSGCSVERQGYELTCPLPPNSHIEALTPTTSECDRVEIGFVGK